jgi:putative transposase
MPPTHSVPAAVELVRLAAMGAFLPHRAGGVHSGRARCERVSVVTETRAAIDFFVVPTATFRVLFVFVVLSCDRRRMAHFNVTSSPNAEWTAQQIVNAFPDDIAPRFLMRDRDAIYGAAFRKRVTNMGTEQVVSAPRSPWQNPYIERLFGSIRCECLDHVIVLGENHGRRILRSYVAYYNESRTHLSLAKDAPDRRAAERHGKVVALPRVGGLHHRYSRLAA